MGRFIILSILAGCAAATTARAEDNPDVGARGVEEARNALRREGFPWYDKNQDSLRPVHVRRKPDDVDVDWDFGQWPRIVAFAITSIILATIGWLIVRAYLLRESTSLTVTNCIRQTAVDDAARIEALPFRIRGTDVDLLAEARRLYEEGKYSEAIVYLFSYQLIDMDRHQLIRLSKGKTNRQYLRELRRRPRLRSIVEQSMIAFEEAFFGGRQLERRRFEAVWQQIEPFTTIVAQPEGT